MQALVPIVVGGHPETGNRGGGIQHLSELFTQRHPPDEIIDPPVHRLRWVLVDGRLLDVGNLLGAGRFRRLEIGRSDFGDHFARDTANPEGIKHRVASLSHEPDGHWPAVGIVLHFERCLKAVGAGKAAGGLEDVESFDDWRPPAAEDIDQTLAVGSGHGLRQVDLQRVVSRRQADHGCFKAGTESGR